MKKYLFLFLIFSPIIVGAALAETPGPPKVDSGDTSWILISSALVMLMTPGLALFYGGMVRSKNVLGTIMQSFIALGVITIQWVPGVLWPLACLHQKQLTQQVMMVCFSVILL